MKFTVNLNESKYSERCVGEFGVLKVEPGLFPSVYIERRETCLGDFDKKQNKKTTFNAYLQFDTYEPIS